MIYTFLFFFLVFFIETIKWRCIKDDGGFLSYQCWLESRVLPLIKFLIKSVKGVVSIEGILLSDLSLRKYQFEKSPEWEGLPTTFVLAPEEIGGHLCSIPWERGGGGGGVEGDLHETVLGVLVSVARRGLTPAEQTDRQLTGNQPHLLSSPPAPDQEAGDTTNLSTPQSSDRWSDRIKTEMKTSLE